MLYTRKGDDGKTKTFACDQRISKSSAIAEALGTLDEINSFLGICKVLAKKDLEKDGLMKVDIVDSVSGLEKKSVTFESVLHDLQETLFIIQAELAGAPKSVSAEKVKGVEEIVDSIEKFMPPIKTFFISGGTEMASHLDFARTLIRRAERRVVAVSEEGLVKMSKDSMAYLNRGSSLLYAMARFANWKIGEGEQAPKY